MKTIRIFAVPSHTFIDRVSGVDYLRVIQPMKYLADYQDQDTKFEITCFDPRTMASFDWRDVFRDNDIIFFNYTVNDIGYAVMGTMAQKYGRKLVVDVDDALHEILPDNPAHEIYKKGSWGREVVTAILGDVHCVTCTNEHLKHSIEANSKAKNIEILPNYIDLSLYKHRSPFKDRGYYKAIHFGSSTHFSSFYSAPFMEGMDRIMKEYPNFSFLTVGAFVGKFRQQWGARYEQGFGDSDFYKWVDKMPAFMDDADFSIVPLINNSYNRSKSSTKFNEVSSFKMPGVWQRLRQYNEVVNNGDNGYLASTSDEWYTSIKSLLDDAKKRQTMGENAFNTVMGKYTIQANIKKYAELFKKVLDS